MSQREPPVCRATFPRVPDSPAITLTSPVTAIPGIGPRRAEALAELGVRAVGQLVAYLPHRHEKLEAETPIGQLAAGANVATRGEVTATRIVRRGKPRFEAVLIDDTGRLDLVWFNGLYLHGTITPGVRLRVQGKCAKFGPGLQMANVKHEILRDDAEPPLRDEKLRPVYPASSSITSQQIEQAIGFVLPHALPLIHDHLPERFRDERNLPSLADAYRLMHQPQSEDDVAAARRRLAYDELLMLQLGLALKRSIVRQTTKAPALPCTPAIDKAIRARLPFKLTAAQDRVVLEVASDLARAEPASRLIQGDVGSGKTVVALYAMLLAVAAKRQAALMAPTEILAEQHYASIRKMLEGSDVRIVLITGSMSAADRAAALAGLADGSIDIAIGTHALFAASVAFKSLAVAVVDEQHRFGVHQRLALRSKGETQGVMPHVLVMTATPIPRTLAMTVLGDLDVSTIDGLPPGRKKVITRVVDVMAREEVYKFARERLDAGERAFIVAPAIDREVVEEGSIFESASPQAGSQPGQESKPLAGQSGSALRADGGLETRPPHETEGSATFPASSAKLPTTVADLHRELEAGPLAGKKLAVLHGRIDPATRDVIMARFRAGQIDALIATTVIEVGVDVPDATLMIVEDADRFGLATLHQLRGRVGRGKKGGVCVLITQTASPTAGERLAVMAKTSDGFKLAQKDIEIRGFGDVIGVRQSGMPPFAVADLARDLDLLTMARRDATAWLDRSPRLAEPDDKLARSRLLKQHGKWLGLADVG